MTEQSYDDYLKELFNEGLIDHTGKPLKCPTCKSENFFEQDHVYLDVIYGLGPIIKYTLKCNDCNKTVGRWVTGHWEVY